MRVVSAAPRLPHGARDLGALRSDATVAGAVALKPRNQKALTRFLAGVTDKHSPLFHHYLAPGQFAARFGPTPSTIAAVSDRLRAAGLTVTVARGGTLVDFRGTAAQVENAFGVGLNRVRLADGSIGRVRTSAIRLPETVARLVTSVVGLDNTIRLRPSAIMAGSRAAAHPHAAAKTATFPHPAGSPTPCSDAQSAAVQFGGLTDDQIANAYGAFGLYGANDVGAGQHIAVFELEPFATSDIQAFDACYFGNTAATTMLSRLTTIPVDGGQPAGPGSGESLLDIEDVAGLAPGANIDVYEAPNTTYGAIDEYAAIVNNDTASIVSSSWGLCEQAVEQGEPGVMEAENLLFQQAAAQGQSIFASAGDSGSDDCNAFYLTSPVTPVLSQDDPASQPYVVGVGGTTIDEPSQPATEHVWNDGVLWGAGGGGISQAWPMPAWQLSSLVPGSHDAATIQAANTFEANDLGQPGYAFCLTDNPAGANQAACREVPDVSAEADEFTGGITVYGGSIGGWQTFGGTSSATPIWAALLAVTNASAACQSNITTANGVGFVSPLLYSVASSPTAYAASFNDIKSGNNDTFGSSQLFAATTGYDMASGLGSPQLTQPNGGAGLAYYLCAAAAAGARPTVTNLGTKLAFTSAASTSVTITGTNFMIGGVSDVSRIQVGDYALAPGAFTVNSANSIAATFPAAARVVPSSAPTDGAGRVQVIVTLTDGESSAPNAASAFTYVDQTSGKAIPSITSVGPYGGPEAGGNTVIIYGAGFTGATSVKFGTVAAGAFTVLHDWEISATVPAYSAGATTCVQNGSTYGENATNDVCQVQVVVANANGSSKKAPILPLYEGDASYTDMGSIKAPPGEEVGPAPTEYDYFPAPTITSISTDNGPLSLASEYGDNVITIKGTGFNPAALAWVTFGDPNQDASQDFDYVSVTGTQIQIVAAPFDNPTVDTATLPVAVHTIAGQSNSMNATYAGIPTVTGVVATAGLTAGKSAGPDTGGTPIHLSGTGFASQVFALVFSDALGPFSVGTQYQVNATSDTDLTSKTVAQNPGLVDVEACTVTACSVASPADNRVDAFMLYPPGDPKVESITPASGPADGGTMVTINGENLGCVTGVYFGKVPAEKFSNPIALLDCGTTTQITVDAPPGTAGRSVFVTVTTVESDATGSGPRAHSVKFRYTHPSVLGVRVKLLGDGTGAVTSSPHGITCGKICRHKFVYGTSVTLTAKAAAGSRFSNWGGACSGTQPTCTVEMKKRRFVKAHFSAK